MASWNLIIYLEIAPAHVGIFMRYLPVILARSVRNVQHTRREFGFNLLEAGVAALASCTSTCNVHGH